MEKEQLSPHDETILFELVEIERSLPREEQSRRFRVKIRKEARQARKAFIEPAVTSKEFVLVSDAECFKELAAAGYTAGGRVTMSSSEQDYLDVVSLTESAFKYYDEKHDFPTILADQRRDFVDSKVSTLYPEVVAHLKKAYDAIWIEQPEGNWSSVAHDCGAALRSFADAVYKPEHASKFDEEVPSSADFEKKLEQAIRANTGDQELRGLLVKLNAYANARRHDPGTSRREAKRCILLTYMLLAEICEALGLADNT